LVPVDDSHKDAPLVLVGPNELSGTHAAFQRQILADQTPLTNTLVSCDSHTQILERVAHEPQGLGFLSAVWLDDNANVLAIAADQDSPAQLPSNLSGSHPDQSYPLERDLFLVFSGGPDRQLTATERAFLEFVLSEDGLILVQRTRFVPLPPEQLAATRQQLAKRLLELN
jgi:phosphate transport system substrate-binding protein